MRKFFWGTAALAFVGLLVWFSMDSSKAIAVTDGGRITEADFYSRIRKSADGQQLFAQMVIDKVLESKYKDEVTDDMVNQAYNLQKAQFGVNFGNFLAANSLTEESYKAQIKSNLLMQQAVMNGREASEEEMQAAFEDYTPAVEVSLIPVNDEATAQSVVDQARGGADFAALAKEFSTDQNTAKKGGVVPAFDSNSGQVSRDMMETINGIDEGNVSDPYQTDTGWLVIRVNKKTPKSENMNDHINEVKRAATIRFMGDSANQKAIQDIIGKIMKQSNVDIKEDDLKPAISGYLK